MKIKNEALLALCGLFFVSAAELKNYRVFDETSPQHVQEFYRLNHQEQTLDFVLKKKKEYYPLDKAHLSIWEAFALLETLVDDSDPDLDLPQCYHAFQTAEALRLDGHPRWLILAGFIHDLGKMLAHFGEPQWAVVGDTFPVGCAYSDAIVFPHFLLNNPDKHILAYQTEEGIYTPHCGLDQVHMSWGHDEYLYQVVKDYLPEEALFIIRYHSFYALHEKNAYTYLLNDKDRELLPWLQLFCSYDLYSKSTEKLNISSLMPYYEDLIKEFFPSSLNW